MEVITRFLRVGELGSGGRSRPALLRALVFSSLQTTLVWKTRCVHAFTEAFGKNSLLYVKVDSPGAVRTWKTGHYFYEQLEDV